MAAALAVNVGVVAGGGGHTHDGSGHGGAEEGASGHGEPGHHAESSGTGGAGGPSTAETARGEGSGGDGHPHPDGGRSGSEGADARESGGPTPAGNAAASTPSGGSDAGGYGGETGDRLVDAAALQHAAYFHLWFLVGALGFAYSAAVAHGGARKGLYGTAALLNAAMVLALVAVPDARDVAFLVAAAVQGLPMLVDLPLRTRAGRAAA